MPQEFFYKQISKSKKFYPKKDFFLKGFCSKIVFVPKRFLVEKRISIQKKSQNLKSPSPSKKITQSIFEISSIFLWSQMVPLNTIFISRCSKSAVQIDPPLPWIISLIL